MADVAPRVLTAFEYDVLRVGDGSRGTLSPNEASRLLALNVERSGFCSLVPGGLRLAGFAGLVSLGERILEVLPKVGDETMPGKARGTFLRLLRLSGEGVPVLAFGNVGHDLERHNLLAVFASRFLVELSTLVRGGLVRRYRVSMEDLRVVRGRLDLARQATVLAMRPDVVANRFVELCLDNPWNQVLVAALVKVRPWIESLNCMRLWMELMAAFAEVSRVPDAVSLLGRLVPDRQVARYGPSIEWAGLILRLLSPNIRAGRADAPELLMDMARLFEAAVKRVLRERAPELGVRVTAQERDRHLATVAGENPTGMFQLQPDLVIRGRDGLVAVGDTKWKRLWPGQRQWLVPAAADAYQMHAYAAAYGCEDLCLVYPYHSGLEGAIAVSFKFPHIGGAHPPRLHLAFVDVGQDGLPVKLSSDGTWFAREHQR